MRTSHPPHHHPQRGFTLIELMVVVVIIGILATLAFPRLRIAMLEGSLDEAKPYLSAIAAKMRIYNNQRGAYYTYTTAGDEQELENNLGVDLRDARNFCFMIRTGDGNYISDSGDGNAEFEVWAVLRSSSYSSGTPENDTVGVYSLGGANCITADQKNAADGWVNTDSTLAGGEGRVVVLRYPPPTFAVDTASRNGRSGLNLVWTNGMTITDVMVE